MTSLEEVRRKAKKILETYSKIPKNIEIIEKKILDLASEEDKEETSLKIVKYQEIFMQVAYLFEKGEKVKNVIQLLREGKINYNHPDYELTRNKQKEYDDYLLNPFQIKRGIVSCSACGGDRTMSCFKQDRGGDEGTSVYSQCIDCKHKWRENN